MKISQTKDIRSANRLTILKHIFDKKQISRARISEETGLNKATVSTIIKELISLKLVEETTIGDSSGGRKPIILTLNGDAGYCIAVDLGAKNIECILTNLRNEIIHTVTLPLLEETFSQVYKQLYLAIDKLFRLVPPCPYGLIGISLAVRGIIDLDGIIRFIPNLKWHNIDIKSLLEQRYHVPVYVNNDGNLAASMEFRLRSHYRDMTVLCLSDVISCGIISNGRLVRGYLGFANAVGHHTINIRETKQCSCGKYGCFEQYCSDQYLIDEMNQQLEEPLTDIDQFIDLVKRQDKEALDILARYIKNLAIGLSNIVFFLNSEVIIINSYLMESLPYLLPEVMKDIVLPITHTQEIYLSRLGQKAPILGASMEAIEQFFEVISSHG